MERFAALVPSLRVTEFDIDVGDDGARQAELMRDYLTILFSHEAMEAVTLWGFWENAHRRPDAALYESDWTEKESLVAYQDLVLGEWWTDESLATGLAGEAELRAFLGDYVATVTVDGVEYERRFALGADGLSLVVQVPEPGAAALLALALPLGLRRSRPSNDAQTR